jgi:hypothetical protein
MRAAGGNQASVFPLISSNTAKLQFGFSQYCRLMTMMMTITIMLNYLLFTCFFLIDAVELWVLRPLLAYCTSPK